MARPPSRHPTELELEILKIMWDTGPAPVRRVRAALAESTGRDLAYTSVMTVMGIMTDKGYLKRKKKGVGYEYQTRIRRTRTTRQMLRDLIDRAFDGSAGAVALKLLQEADLDDDQLCQIREILDRKS